MIVNIIENSNIKETKISIECNKTDESIIKLVSLIKNINNNDRKIIGISQGETYCLEQDRILYFESVDRKTFCYTEDSVFEVGMKLYEIDEKYENTSYLRISKSVIVNLNRVKSVKPEFDGKMLATMDNSEKIYISRQYVSEFKKKIGIGGKKDG